MTLTRAVSAGTLVGAAAALAIYAAAGPDDLGRVAAPAAPTSAPVPTPTVTQLADCVAPAVLEDRLRAHLLVDQCVVVGDGQPFIGALITLDRESVPTWAESHGKSKNVRDLVDDPDLRAEIEAAVEDANKAVSRAESIRRFTVLPEDFTEERGHLTPSLKLRRAAIARDFADEIDRLYEREGPNDRKGADDRKDPNER